MSDNAQEKQKPPYPTDEADKKLATDWYTWGFQSGFDVGRDRIEQLEAALRTRREEAGKFMTDIVAAANKDAAIAAARIEQLEAALREVAVQSGYAATIARAALDQSSPPETQPPPYNPDDWGLPPARQENDDVFPGFRGNNEA